MAQDRAKQNGCTTPVCYRAHQKQKLLGGYIYFREDIRDLQVLLGLVELGGIPLKKDMHLRLQGAVHCMGKKTRAASKMSSHKTAEIT